MTTVLVVEDNKAARNMAVSTIEKMGYIALSSSNGKLACEVLLANEGIDLVLTDIMMPEMDGRELIQAIRQDGALAALPIIAMSSVTKPEEVSGLLELGANLFMHKPFTPGDLQENIKRCLAGK